MARTQAPKKKAGSFRLIVIACAILIVLTALQRKREEESQLRQLIDSSLQALAGENLSLDDSGLSLEILPTGRDRLDARQIERMLRATGDKSASYAFNDRNGTPYTMSAQGVDSRQHLVNTFLEGYEPFKVGNLALPLYAIAKRKSYQLDEKQYPGRPEVWQSSRQSFYFPRGDCEDHAILLADWLITMGEDARVALGDVDGNGHAWVILFKNGREYLLEATQKRGLSRNKAYPLAALATRYTPEYMFNREYFWINTGSKFTTRYSGSTWRMKSRLSQPLRAAADSGSKL